MSERFLQVTPAEFAELQAASGDAVLLDGRPDEAAWLAAVGSIVGTPAAWGPMPEPVTVKVRTDVAFIPMLHCGVKRWATAEDIAAERPSMRKSSQDAVRDLVERHAGR